MKRSWHHFSQREEEEEETRESVTAPSRALGMWQQNPTEEPRGPLGLKLRRSSSLIDLIELTLSLQAHQASSCSSRLTPHEKRKATNFSASLLRIGSWEYTSRYECDLVVKCYFAKRKLVWEVLEGGLKSKIEIQWSDITALQAVFPDNKPSILQIELARPPMFFKESNPQPRKHTIWQATSDFTGGQATVFRRHILQFPHGTFERHFESLIQCDSRLNMLSKKGVNPQADPRFVSFASQHSRFLAMLQAASSINPNRNYFVSANSQCMPSPPPYQRQMTAFPIHNTSAVKEEEPSQILNTTLDLFKRWQGQTFQRYFDL